MTDGERKFFQGFVNGVYEQFLDDVVDGAQDPQGDAAAARRRAHPDRASRRSSTISSTSSATSRTRIEGAAKLAGASGEPVPVFQKKPRGSVLGEMLRGAVQGAIEGAAPRGSIEVRDPRL